MTYSRWKELRKVWRVLGRGNIVIKGERFEAKFGRSGFRRNFVFEKQWRNRYYKNKQVEVYAVREGNDWLVISVIVRYF